MQDRPSVTAYDNEMSNSALAAFFADMALEAELETLGDFELERLPQPIRWDGIVDGHVRIVMSEIMDADEPIEKPENAPLLAALITMSGLTQTEAGGLLGLAPQSVRQKVTGRRGVSDHEVSVMLVTWRKIEVGDVNGLPDGAKAVAAALAWTRRQP